jgi:DNA-binding transcriptional LysR family regulator
MARFDVNRSGEMEVFVRVVELGGFSAAARAFRMTPSAVSKLVARLEARLGVRLLNRSTRSLQLTPEGAAFHERARGVLAELDDAERSAASGATPAGKLRVNTNLPFGHHFLLPLVPEFLARYPQVTLDIVLTDTVVDLVADRTDVAIRAGPLRPSSLVARKLFETRMAVVGAPDYFARHGTPATPRDLAQHNCLTFGYARSVEGWPFVEDGRALRHMPRGNAQAGDGVALRQLAVLGVGLARVSLFHAADDIAAGRLVPVLEDCNPGDTETFSAVFLGHGGRLPARVRALLDFLVERVRFPGA